MRDWLDVFNHRFISLFYRAWEKYRFYIPYERGDYALGEPDTFTQALFSFVGLGFKSLRDRIARQPATWSMKRKREVEHFAKIDDLVLLHYGGLLAHRPRNAVSLEHLLSDYFGHPAEVRQFQGQWLALDRDNQTQMGPPTAPWALNVVAGERVWDVQSKFRVRMGPLNALHFTHFLPDRTPSKAAQGIFPVVAPGPPVCWTGI